MSATMIETTHGADRFCKVAEVAEMLNLSRSAVYEMMDAGKLRYCRLPGSGERCTRRVRLSDVQTMIERSMVGGCSESNPPQCC